MNELFDRVATWCAKLVGRAPFFIFCLLSIVIWMPSFPLFDSLDAWQLPINTFTTVVTFLLVALLQNTQGRTERALNRKLDAIADGLADVMDHLADGDETDLDDDIDELRNAAGVEMEPSD